MEIQSSKELSRTALDKQLCHVLCSHRVDDGKTFHQRKKLPPGKKFFVPLQKSKIHCVLLKTDRFKNDLDP